MLKHDPNATLTVSTEETDVPSYLTIILKTLYVRYLDEPDYGRILHPLRSSATRLKGLDTELLVTCTVKSSESIAETVLPVIFEPDFCPSSFVNRKDRIVYGPSPFQGQAIDVGLTMLELDDLNNAAVNSGFKAISDSVATLNPELYAATPLINELFRTIVKHATANDNEFDFSFTLFPPEGEGKSDVDRSVAETGHYILLKTENPTRGKSGIDKASKRGTYRNLVYNPKDGLLYHRRNFQNPAANFAPGNEFMDQSYAVLVVTDEYTSADELGARLRQQISQTLGERRAREVLPNAKELASLFQEFETFSTAQPGSSTKRMTTNELATIVAMKDQLWKGISSIRKQLIVERLHSLAPPDVRRQLGRDIDKWKSARLVIGKDGDLQIDRVEGATAPANTTPVEGAKSP